MFMKYVQRSAYMSKLLKLVFRIYFDNNKSSALILIPYAWLNYNLIAFQQIKMNKNNMLKPYTVHYRDFQNIRLENCFYAFDAYEARTLAMEFNKYINEHPNSIDLIRCEK